MSRQGLGGLPVQSARRHKAPAILMPFCTKMAGILQISDGYARAMPLLSGRGCIVSETLLYGLGKESYTCHICNMMNDIIHQKQCQ